MRFANFLMALSTLAVAPATNALCYTTGLEGDRTLAHQRVGRMCDFLAGNYAPGEAKHHAFTYNQATGSPRRWDFWITNTRNVAAFNSYASCAEFLNREIDCLQGGETYYPTLGWRFLADPNGGACVQNCEE